MNHDDPNPHHSNPGHAHSDEEEARLNQASLLEEERQRQLARHRAYIQIKVAAEADPLEIIQYQQERLVNRPQHSTWGDFCP